MIKLVIIDLPTNTFIYKKKKLLEFFLIVPRLGNP